MFELRKSFFLIVEKDMLKYWFFNMISFPCFFFFSIQPWIFNHLDWKLFRKIWVNKYLKLQTFWSALTYLPSSYFMHLSWTFSEIPFAVSSSNTFFFVYFSSSNSAFILRTTLHFGTSEDFHQKFNQEDFHLIIWRNCLLFKNIFFYFWVLFFKMV